MAQPNQKNMLRDASNHFIPQYWDGNDFQPLQDLSKVYAQSTTTAFQTGAVTVTSTPTKLSVGLTDRNQVILYPPDVGSIYWGTSTVTQSTGAPLKAGDSPMEFDFKDTTLNIWAVSDGTDRTIRIVESK
jgi:hypothetical protein